MVGTARRWTFGLAPGENLEHGGQRRANPSGTERSALVMLSADPRNRGPIWGEFTRAQHRQAVSNLARAFHLPRPQAKTAILVMLGGLTQSFDEQTLTRETLAKLVELLGKNDYERFLETPTLMGDPQTQAIGNEALTTLVGPQASARLVGRAAAVAGISQTVAEYLLPVVAAMFLGALAAKTRGQLVALARNAEVNGAAEAEPEVDVPAIQLPVGRGSSGFFSSGPNPEREALYRDLADRIRAGASAAGDDPLGATRRIMAQGLGVRARYAPWLTRLQLWSASTLHSAGTQAHERLRRLRNRPHGDN